jgi:hypothetical protein
MAQRLVSNDVVGPPMRQNKCAKIMTHLQSLLPFAMQSTPSAW